MYSIADILFVCDFKQCINYACFHSTILKRQHFGLINWKQHYKKKLKIKH